LSPEIAASVGALGYSFHHGRWTDDAGHQLTVRIGVDASLPYAKTLVRTLFAQLNVAGIGSVFVREFGENGAARALRAGSLDAAIVVRVAPQAPSQEASWFTSASSGGANAENPGGYSNPSVDALFSRASRELNPVDATDSYSAIDALVAADAAVIPLVSLPYLQVWRTRLNGLSVLPYGGSVTQNAGRWTFVAPMAATVSTK
jgi:ABC-type transport system substrate-binding protein